MKTCTFFGHRDTPKEIEPSLRAVLTELVEQKGVTQFYVGNQGGFDHMVEAVLAHLQNQYPHICSTVVLAYLPKEKNNSENTLYPEGLELVPPKFAIDRRNRWMLDHADYVVTYVVRPFGGAAKFKLLAEKSGRYVYELAKKDCGVLSP